MRNILLILILFCDNLFCQEFSVQSSTVTPNIILNGSIDKYKINVLLNVVGDQILGSYTYKNSDNSIPISGFIRDGYIWLNEYLYKDNQYLLNASFKGDICKDSVYGDWTNLKNKHFRFALYTNGKYLVRDENQSGINLMIDDRGLRNIFVDIGLTSIYKMSIICKVKKENKFYVLVKCDAYTNGACNSHGTCGCGVESEIVWIQLSDEYKLEKTEFLLIGSCIESIETYNEQGQNLNDENLKDDMLLKMYDAHRNEHSLITFKLQMPELGIIKEKIN